MTKLELIEKMKDLPDNAPVILIDMSTDDPYECTLSYETEIDDYFKEVEEQEKPEGKALFIYFDNILEDKVEELKEDIINLNDENMKFRKSLQKVKG